MKTLYIAILYTSILFCSCNLLQDSKRRCNLVKVETIFVDVATKGGMDPHYIHHVLVEGYSKNCLIDSIDFFRTTKKYLDTVNLTTKPISRISFYSSKDRFIPSETSQIWDDVNKDCIVTVKFKATMYEPLEFVFYDRNGNAQAKTRLWKKYE